MWNVSYHPISDDFELRENGPVNGAFAVRNLQELCIWLQLSADGMDGRYPPACPPPTPGLPPAQASSPENVPRGTRIVKASADGTRLFFPSASNAMKKRALGMLRTGKAAFITLFLKKGV